MSIITTSCFCSRITKISQNVDPEHPNEDPLRKYGRVIPEVLTGMVADYLTVSELTRWRATSPYFFAILPIYTKELSFEDIMERNDLSKEEKRNIVRDTIIQYSTPIENFITKTKTTWSITHLNFTNYTKIIQDNEIVDLIIEKCPNLTHLDLHDTQYDLPAGLSMDIARRLIDLSKINLNLVSQITIDELEKHCKKLQHVDLRGCILIPLETEIFIQDFIQENMPLNNITSFQFI